MYLPKKTYWYDQYGYTTVKEHMPESHLAYEHNRAQNAATLIDRVQRVSPFTRWAVENILQRTSFPQQAYDRCNGVLLLRTYGYDRLGSAAALMKAETGKAAYQRCRKHHHIIQNMSRRGNCLDNSVTENFFGIMKSELLYAKKYTSKDCFITDLKEYMEYNN